MPRPRPALLALVLGVYVLPVGGAALFLVVQGLPVLAAALVAVEVVMVGLVLLARRRPDDA